MHEETPPDAPGAYAERLVRSVAHNTGNVFNVISGRLSILELQDNMGTEAIEIIGLMRDRLRKAQGELRDAVRFVSETLNAQQGQDKRLPVFASLESVAPRVNGGIEGYAELAQDERVQKCTSPFIGALFELLHDGLSGLTSQSTPAAWRLSVTGESLLLQIEAASASLPADRRALLEPWFDPAAINGAADYRRARLDTAIALGKIEDAGAQLSALPSEDKAVSRINLNWFLGS